MSSLGTYSVEAVGEVSESQNGREKSAKTLVGGKPRNPWPIWSLTMPVPNSWLLIEQKKSYIKLLN